MSDYCFRGKNTDFILPDKLFAVFFKNLFSGEFPKMITSHYSGHWPRHTYPWAAAPLPGIPLG